MTSIHHTDTQDGVLPTGFVSQEQAEKLCQMLTLTAAQTEQVSGGGVPTSALNQLFVVRKICLIRTCFPITCYPIDLGSLQGSLTLPAVKA